MSKRFMTKRLIFGAVVAALLPLVMAGCTVARRLESKVVVPKVSHTSKMLRDKVKFEEQKAESQLIAVTDSATGKTLFYGDQSNTVLAEDGERMAKIDIEAISIRARSRTLPERNGMVDVDFLIMLPAALQGESQSLIITPALILPNGEHRNLEPLQIRGGLFSKLQERNYWRFAKYRDGLEQKYNFGEMSKSDSANLKRVFEEFVRYPYLDHARMDSISRGKDVVTYHYREKVKVDNDLKRMQIVLEGSVRALDGSAYILPVPDTLQFNLSSMLAFVDNGDRFKTRIVEKFAFVQDRNYLTFKMNNTKIIDTMGSNAEQLEKMGKLMYEVLYQSEFHVDSIILTATSSPEGSFAINTKLARERAHSLSDYLRAKFDFPEMDTLIKVRWIGEDWGEFVNALDTHRHNIKNFDAIRAIASESGDRDALERRIRQQFADDYKYISQKVYPMLRAVNFKYDLRRVGMLKDTIHTQELDTAYMRGVELLKDRKYGEAHQLLFESRSQNSAVCMLSLGYNRAAYDVLMELQSTPTIDYLRAVVCSRLAMDEDGRAHFFKACDGDPTLEYRGRLDPEITAIIDFDKLTQQREATQ